MHLLGLVVLVCSVGGGPGAAAGEPEPVRLPFTGKHLEDSLRTDWFGVYLKDKKIGYGRTSLSLEKTADGDHYQLLTHLRIEAKSAGLPLRVEITETLLFEPEAPHSLAGGKLVQGDGKVTQEVKLVRTGDGFRSVTTVGDQRTTRQAKGKVDYTLTDVLTSYVWVLGGPKEGEAIWTRSFDFDKLQTQPQRRTVKAVRRSRVKGVEVKYYETDVFDPVEKVTVLERVDADGNFLSGQIGGLFEMRAEPEEEAKNLDSATDLFVMGLVKVDRPLRAAPGEAKGLVVEVVGGKGPSLPSGPWQHVDRRPDGKLVCKVGRGHAEPVQATAKEVEEALEETTSYPVRHPRVRKLAREAVGDAATDREKVERLVDFVHSYIRPSYRQKGLIVLDLLDKRQGDCTAYAALFATLARAAGVPCREVSGFAYMGDSAQAFGGHAWNEVVIDGHWHPVDASAGQADADAARIRMGSDLQGGLNLLDSFGSLSLRLIEVER